MNPHQKNKIDISKLSEEELKIFRLYGKVPNRGDLLQNKLKERKYFDSGDYALSKAGKASDAGVTSIGSQHPLPENIPHLSSPGPQSGGNNGAPPNGNLAAPNAGAQGSSPVKEGSFLQRTTSVDEEGLGEDQNAGSKPWKRD
ncbi:MAG: hypothetical protein LQ340_006881 [Diploschistes diacapsis]|nr:MAG: hypothetical protein LQ340_006881 [Diploschistes diacapsis]